MKKLTLLLACTAVVALVGTYVVAVTPVADNEYGNVYCATCGCSAAKGAKGTTAAPAKKACPVGCTKPCCAAAAKGAEGKTSAKKPCAAGCTKPCCAASAKGAAGLTSVAKKGCGPNCTKPCCVGPAGKIPPAAYELTLKNQDNKDTKLPTDAKYTVLVWYNWDCPFVKRHLAEGTVEKLAAKYKDKGVAFVVVNSTKSQDVERNKKEYARHDLTMDVLDDHKGELGRLLGAKTTPHVIIADQRHREYYNGAIDNDPRGKSSKTENYVDITLGALLEGSDVKTPKTKPYGCSVKYAPLAKP